MIAQTNANGDENNPVVLVIFKEVVDTLKWEKEHKTVTPMEIARNPVSRRRLLVGASVGPFSCVAGNVIASYFLGKLAHERAHRDMLSLPQGLTLSNAGITDSNDQLKANVVLNVFCLFTCLVGTHLCAKWGRKPTALTTECLLVLCLFIIGGLTKMYGEDPDGASNALIYGNVATMFLFQGFYSVAWTPLLYLYPPEVMNYSIRANGLAFSSFGLNALAWVSSLLRL